MPQSPPHDPARELLRAYADAWAEEASIPPPALLVDLFAGSDYPTAEPPGPGAARAAARLIGPGSGERGAVVLLEEDPAKLEWLAARISEQGIAVAPAGEEPACGRATLREGGASRLESIAALRDSAGAALLLADAPAAGAIPLAALAPWLAAPGVDLLVRLPMCELRRLAGYPASPIADLPPRLRRSVEGVSAFLGDARHAWMRDWSASLAGGVERALDGFGSAYAARVRELGAPIVRRVRLPGADGAGEMMLCTHRPERALLLNRVVHGLRGEGVLDWPEDDPSALVRYPPRAELGLFARTGGGDVGGVERERVVDHARLTRRLAARFRGRRVTLEELLRELTETELFLEEARRALLALRREGRKRGPARAKRPAAGLELGL